MSKPITKYSATERQEAKKELEDQLPAEFFTYSRCWWTLNEPYPHDHWDDWQSYKPFTENTIGGKFLTALTKLHIIDPFVDNGYGGHKKNQEVYWLYEKLAVAPSGYIYISDGPDKIHLVRVDAPTLVKLKDIAKATR
jgi:hypothetical protein